MERTSIHPSVPASPKTADEPHLDADPFAGEDEAWAAEDEPVRAAVGAEKADQAALDAARFFRGLIFGLAMSALAWLAIAGVVWAAFVLIA